VLTASIIRAMRNILRESEFMRGTESVHLKT
jgi:hypothetical protein